MSNELTATQAIELGRKTEAVLVDKLTESVIARINGVIRLKAETGHASGEVNVVHYVGVWQWIKGLNTVYIEAETPEILAYVIENINIHYKEFGFETKCEFDRDKYVTTICWGN